MTYQSRAWHQAAGAVTLPKQLSQSARVSSPPPWCASRPCSSITWAQTHPRRFIVGVAPPNARLWASRRIVAISSSVWLVARFSTSMGFWPPTRRMRALGSSG